MKLYIDKLSSICYVSISLLCFSSPLPFFHFFKFFDSWNEQKFFSELQDRQYEFGISDIQLGLTTLEEVFLNIARQAELETATAEGRLVNLTLTSGASVEVRTI